MKPKKLPRLWCALQGLLPLEACLAAQRAELAWPREEPRAASLQVGSAFRRAGRGNGVAKPVEGRDVGPDVPLRNQE